MMEDLGDKNQPIDFQYPKRQFGKTKIVSRSFQCSWYKSWPWLHYMEVTDSVICYTCATAGQQNKLTPSAASKMYEAFVTTGFVNWKDATVSFRKHESSECHRAATEVMVTLPTQTVDIGEQLCTQLRNEKADNCDLLLKILGNTLFNS